MDHRQSVVSAFLALFCSVASAGWAEATAPSNWGGNASEWTYKAASNDVSFTGGVRGAGGTVNVGGRAVTMNAAYRFAANAPRMAARFAFGNPALFLLATGLPIAYDWFKQSGFEVKDGVWKQKDPSICTVSPCYEYSNSVAGDPGPTTWHSTKLGSCQAAVARQQPNTSYYVIAQNPRLAFNYGQDVCRVDFYRRSNGTFESTQDYTFSSQTAAPQQAQYTPVTGQAFEDAMASKPLPNGLPQELPTPLPVELPVSNPSPGDNPSKQSIWVPQGSPQPVPNTNPQQYKTPGVRVDPNPFPLKPWWMEIIPEDKIGTDPTPTAQPVEQPTPDPGTTTESREQDLCEKYPDSLMCQKINPGSLDPVPVTNATVDLSIQQDSGWNAGSGSCPAPRTAAVQGVTISLPFDLLCDFAQGIRPVVIALAWIAAAVAFFGLSRKD